MKKKPMRSFCDLDSVTFTCPCGESISGEGLIISEFIHQHKGHTNGKCVDTITEDGLRAFTRDIPRTRTYSITECKSKLVLGSMSAIKKMVEDGDIPKPEGYPLPNANPNPRKNK